jgi:hypothetical protein
MFVDRFVTGLSSRIVGRQKCVHMLHPFGPIIAGVARWLTLPGNPWWEGDGACVATTRYAGVFGVVASAAASRTRLSRCNT